MKRIHIVFVLASLFAALLSQQTSVASNHDTCNGKMPTVEGTEGTEGDDVILAEGTPSLVRGYGGHDTICVFMDEENPGHVDVFAGEGDDWVYVWGEYNTSRVYGEGGNDHLKAEGDHTALLNGGPGDDTIQSRLGITPWFGSLNVAVFEDVGAVEVDFATGIVTTEDGTDTLDGIAAVLGGPGNDVFRGTKGKQFINGGAGNDRIFGGPGADALDGGPGNDILRGGRGRDRLSGSLGDDDIRGNKGIDYLWFQPGFSVTRIFPFQHFWEGGEGAFPGDALAQGVRVNLFKGTVSFPGADDRVKGIEGINAFDGDDVLIGNAKGNTIFGHDGADRLFGYGGNDRLFGGSGFDRINGGAGSDLCVSGRVYKNCEKQRRYAPMTLY